MPRRPTPLAVLLTSLALLGLGSLGVVGWVVWGAAHGQVKVSLPGNTSAYVKCNGLNKVEQASTGAIPTTYRLIDKRYICRGFRGNTPQRVTQITYTYAGDNGVPAPEAQLADYLRDELDKAGWASPGIATINSETTALRLTREPMIGLSYHVVSASTPMFQIVVFARDRWQPGTQDKRAPQNLVVSDATVGKYGLSEYAPTFVPTGYAKWRKEPFPRGDELDTRSLTGQVYELSGGRGDVNPEVTLSPAAAGEMHQLCSNDPCAEVGKNTEGTPIFTGDDGNAIYSQLGETFVKIDQLTNFNSKPQVGLAAGLKILASMQPPT